VVWARSLGDDALTEARVGLAGPIFGAVASAAVAVAGLATHTELLEALGYFGFFLNLFNLMPVVPLDGGRAMAAMAPWMWFAGFGGLVLLEFIEPNPVLLIMCLLAGYTLYQRWHSRKSPTAAQTAYYKVSPRNRMLVGATYIGLSLALAIGMHFTYLHRTI
jgi:Zn-dependent protease